MISHITTHPSPPPLPSPPLPSLRPSRLSAPQVIQKYEDELVHVKQRYKATLQLYEARLREQSIPLEDLGFSPLREI